MNPLPMTEADLHAYVDGLLPAERRTEVEAYLAQRPQEAERVQAYAAQKRSIASLFDPVLDEPMPQRLLDAARRPSAKATAAHSRRWLPRWSIERVAAAFVTLFVGAAAGWFGHEAVVSVATLAQGGGAGGLREAVAMSLPHRAAIAHVVYSPDVRRPVEIGADQEDQLVAWLSKRLGTRIRVPTLGTLGYELIGGRLLPGASGPVAQFMYHNQAGQRLTLYVTNENAAPIGTGFRFAQEGPVNVFYWVDGGFGYALSAGIDRGELARIAAAVYAQFQQG